MTAYTVSLFGNREFDFAYEVEERLENIITDLIKEKEYVEFLVGREGAFDLLAALVIRRCIKKHGEGNTSLVLVLPYIKAEYRNNEKAFNEYYDSVEICEESAKAHFKAAIKTRNRHMIDRSDLVIFCVQEHIPL